MNLLDGIAGVARRGASEADVSADVARVLSALCGVGARQAIQTARAGEWAIAIGCADRSFAATQSSASRVVRCELARDSSALAIHSVCLSDCVLDEALSGRMTTHAEATVASLRGAFALAHWNPHDATLTLARDQLGSRPLSYAHDAAEGRFVFASAAIALVEAGFAPRALSADSLGIYLFNGFLVSPSTMIHGVASALPGQLLSFSTRANTLDKRLYWRQPHTALARSDRNYAQHVDTVRSAFEDVLRRATHDAPATGAFLSGGFDSSMIVAAAHAVTGAVDTLSVGLNEREYDESDQASWIAQRFSRRHVVKTIQPDELDAAVDDVIAAMDQPTHDGFNIFLASGAAAQHGMSTMLSGLGGDEVFGGYPDIAWLPSLAQADSVMSHMPELVKNAGLKIAGSAPFRIGSAVKLAEMFNHPVDGPYPPNGKFMRNLTAAYQTLYMIFPKWARGALIDDDVLRGKQDYFGLPREFVAHIDTVNSDGDVAGSIFRLNTLLFLSERVLRDTYFMTAHHGIDVRAPMVDVDFVTALWSVPIAARAGTRDSKPFQLDIMRSYVGEGFPQRRKRGFMLPFDLWMRSGRLATQIADTLNNARLASSVGLKPSGVAELHRNFVKRRLPIPWHSLWTIFVLMRWCAHHRISL
jgi:asparagine synthase (glutamine-hydrolysing)